jgi:hypothetical protein
VKQFVVLFLRVLPVLDSSLACDDGFIIIIYLSHGFSDAPAAAAAAAADLHHYLHHQELPAYLIPLQTAGCSFAV